MANHKWKETYRTPKFTSTEEYVVSICENCNMGRLIAKASFNKVTYKYWLCDRINRLTKAGECKG